MRYTTSNSSTGLQLRLILRRYFAGFGREIGFEFLYKPTDSKVTYNHFHTQRGSTSALITDITVAKNYEIFIAALDLRSGLPGHFEKFDCKYFTHTERAIMTIKGEAVI